MKQRTGRSNNRGTGTARSGNLNIQTRAQVKIQKETTTGKDDKTKEEIRKKEQVKPGWTSIKDVEQKLSDLGKQLMRARTERSKNQISKLIDVYEKQAKALIIQKHAKEEEANEKLNENAKKIYTIEEEDNEECSVMSDVTTKTTNSYKKILNSTPQRRKPTNGTDKSPYSKDHPSYNSGVVLETLGKTRNKEKKSANKDKKGEKDGTKEERNEESTEKQSKNPAIIVTQEDDCSVMSAITYEKTPERKKTGRMSSVMELNVEEKSKADETSSVMSAITYEIKTPERNTTVKGKSDSNDTTDQKNTDETESVMSELTTEVKRSERGTSIDEKPEGKDKPTDDNQKESKDTGSVMSEITKDNDDQKKDQIEKENDKNKSKNKVENPYNSPTKTRNTSYADVTNKENEKKKVSYKLQNSDTSTNKKFIRLRFTSTKQKFNGSKTAYMKQVLYEMLQCAKEVDSNCGLAPWYENAELKLINGNEIRLLPTELIKMYADMSHTNGEYEDNTTYYGNGVRLSTEMDIEEFISRWNYKRYERSNKNPFKNWKAVKAAEAQGFATATAIGFFSGSIENGYYDTIKKYVKDKYSGEVEVSYQTIYQPGVTQRLWNEASKKAREANKDTSSREYKRIKFGLAPTALVVYVKDENKAKHYRSLFMKEVGDVKEDQWLKMPDASRLKFLPLVNGYINKKEIRDKMYDNIRHQSVSKAGDVLLDLKYMDLKESKDYLHNQSLEQVLHSEMSADDKDIPLFKHITTRWDNKSGTMMFEVAVACSLLEEAKDRLQGMNNTLLKKYGAKVRGHFYGAQLETGQPIATRKRNFTVANNDYDDEIEKFIEKSNTTDKLSIVLIEGMEQLKENEKKQKEKPKAMVIEIPDDEEEDANSTRSNGTETKEKEDSTTSSEESGSKDESSAESDYIDYTIWERISLKEEYKECIEATEKQKRKAMTTIGRKRITIDDIDRWKNKYWIEMNVMMKECENKEYSVMKRIVNSILQEREIELEESEGKKEVRSDPNSQEVNQDSVAGDEAGAKNPISFKSLSTQQEVQLSDKGRGA